MTCERHERDLALHVESDLPDEAADALERHLRTCPRCQAFLQSLAASQRRLKSLAAEPPDEAALLVLRRRVLTAASRDAVPFAPSRGWLWAAALGFVVLTTILGVRYFSAGVQPRLEPETLPAARLVPGRAVRVEQQGSTPPRVHPVSPDVVPQDAPSARTLTGEEADQLARAIVVVSRLERVPDPATEAATPLPAAEVVRLATADPEVVIYWQIDSNGG